MPQPICRYEGSPRREQNIANLLPRLTLTPTSDPPAFTFPVPFSVTSGHASLGQKEYWAYTGPPHADSDSALQEAYGSWGVPQEGKFPNMSVTHDFN
ncbi:hypothetical protein VTI74DRAFT_4279 [Chaetomium olivicolor]